MPQEHEGMQLTTPNLDLTHLLAQATGGAAKSNQAVLCCARLQEAQSFSSLIVPHHGDKVSCIMSLQCSKMNKESWLLRVQHCIWAELSAKCDMK